MGLENHILLSEPSGSNDTQLSFDSTEMLRAVTYHHNGLLYGASRDFGRAIYELICVELTGARYAEEGRSGVGFGGGAAESKVGIVLAGATVCICGLAMMSLLSVSRLSWRDCHCA